MKASFYKQYFSSVILSAFYQEHLVSSICLPYYANSIFPAAFCKAHSPQYFASSTLPVVFYQPYFTITNSTFSTFCHYCQHHLQAAFYTQHFTGTISPLAFFSYSFIAIICK